MGAVACFIGGYSEDIFPYASFDLEGYADYDFDNLVTLFDLDVFANNWLWFGQAGGYNVADLDCDGDSDLDDFAILSLYWLDSCP